MKLYEFNGIKPTIADDVYIQDGVRIEGDVEISEGVSIWYNTTIRGDLNSIYIGKGSNVQELSSLHVDDDYPLSIGDNVTIGHNCIVHGATVGNDCLIGMGSTLLNGCEIPDNCLVGAGSLVTQNAKFNPGMLIVGRPAKEVRPLKEEEKAYVKGNCANYAKLALKHKEK
ncbi:MAG: gamma carbonic anhydrase family protein [Erysipelotrichales bacterium]